MNSIQLAEYKGYQNVMEFLVAQEVERQLNKLPPKMAMYIRSLEVETYALNRLPSLYASSEKGWRHQRQKAELEFRQNITTGVRQAFSAVQVDPLRRSNPLGSVKENTSQESSESQAALQVLRDLLQQPDLSWIGVVQEVKKLLTEQSQYQPPRRNVWHPGAYGKTSLRSKQKADRRDDWNDPLYCQ